MKKQWRNIFFSSNLATYPFQIPGWILILESVGCVAYYVFDTFDGLQARKTGKTSPVGEILDHGGDAIGLSKFNWQDLDQRLRDW